MITEEKLQEILNKYSADIGGKIITEAWFGNVIKDIMNIENSSDDIQNVSDRRKLLIGFFQYLERSHMIKGDFDVNEVVKWFDPNNSR